MTSEQPPGDDERLEDGRYRLDRDYEDAAGYGPAPGEDEGGFGQESGAFADNDQAQTDEAEGHPRDQDAERA